MSDPEHLFPFKIPEDFVPRAHCAGRRAVQLTQSSLTTTLCDETGNTAVPILQTGKRRYTAFKLWQQDQGQVSSASVAHARLHFQAHHRCTSGHRLCGQWVTQKHTEPGTHPTWSCPSQDSGCLLVSDSLSQDSLGLAVDNVPSAVPTTRCGGFRAKATPPPLPPPIGIGVGKSMR